MKCKPSNPSTRALVFRLCMILYISAVAYLCFAKVDSLPKIERSFFGIPADKIAHFCMFFPFPIISFLASDKRRTKFWEAFSFFLMASSVGCIFAGLTEIIQGSLPYRSEDVSDFGADCLAICLSSLIVLIANLLYVHKKK